MKADSRPEGEEGGRVSGLKADPTAEEEGREGGLRITTFVRKVSTLYNKYLFVSAYFTWMFLVLGNMWGECS